MPQPPLTATGKALIVEPGRSRGALAAARALHATGWRIGIGAPHGDLSVHSRAVAWRHEVPSAGADPTRFVDAVARACEAGRYDLVFAADDAELLALSESRGSVSAAVPYAPHEAVVRALDRDRLAEVARAAGLAVPRTRDPDDPALPDVPLMVKSRLRRHGGHERSETQVVGGRDEARAAAARVRAAGEQPVLQEHVSGPLVAVAVVADRDGRIVAAVQQRSDRLYPPGAGMSARAVSVPVDHGLLERIGRLTAALPWFGLAQLQFVAPPGAEPWLVDFNGRFYGSMCLALAAGVNLPALWAELAAGRPAPGGLALGRPGVRYQWLEGDLRRAAVERRGGLLRDLAGVVRPVRGGVGPVWKASDPWPAARYVLSLPARALRRGGG